jgi:prepilin-type N-terminal cleavage/methylation domain-containing protein
MRQRGVTLIELVVATAILGLLIVMLMSFVVDRIVDNAKKTARSDLQLQAQLTLDSMLNEIKHSANVDDQNRWEDPNSPGSPGNNFGWQSDGDTLMLARPVEDADQNIIFEDPQVYLSYKNNVVYYVDDATNTLYKRVIAASVPGNKSVTSCPPSASNCPHDPPQAANVEAFEVTYYDANDTVVEPSAARSVKIRLRLTKRVFSNDISEEYQNRAVFRND